jgi:heme-degrading monooxygenase HmoA
MTNLLTQPPPPDAIAAMAQIPGTNIGPSILVTQAGKAGHAGPEGAGAVLMLQATFADAEKAARFWAAAVPLLALLADAPGFIRRYAFPDGPTITLIALWQTVADAKAFANSAGHRVAVRGLYEGRWEYTHFSAIWELVSSHGRVVFCGACGGVARVLDNACSSCGEPVAGGYASI